MSLFRPHLTSIIVVFAGLLVLTGYLALWILAGPLTTEAAPAIEAPTPVQGQPAAEPADDSPWKTFEIPVLLSPREHGTAADPAIGKLIEQHNARLDQLGAVKLAAQCTWNLDMPGDPRAMTIEFDRATGRGRMNCGKDSSRVEGARVSVSPESAMNIDAMYLLMFRQFDPKGFTAGGASGRAQRVIVAKSETETLEFDEQSGRLVGISLKMKNGVVAVSLSDYQVLPGGAKEALPTLVSVALPAEMFPFERTRGGSVVLKIDAEKSEAKSR